MGPPSGVDAGTGTGTKRRVPTRIDGFFATEVVEGSVANEKYQVQMLISLQPFPPRSTGRKKKKNLLFSGSLDVMYSLRNV